MKKTIVVWATLVLYSTSAFAVDCVGKVTALGFDLHVANPSLVVSLENGPYSVRICTLKEAHNGVDPEICKILHAELLATKFAQKSVLIRFPEHSDCTKIPSWQFSKAEWHNLP